MFYKSTASESLGKLLEMQNLSFPCPRPGPTEPESVWTRSGWFWCTLEFEKVLLGELVVSEPGPVCCHFLVSFFLPFLFLPPAPKKRNIKIPVCALISKKKFMLKVCRRRERSISSFWNGLGTNCLIIPVCLWNVFSIQRVYVLFLLLVPRGHCSHWSLLPKPRLYNCIEQQSTGVNYTVLNLQRVSHKASKTGTVCSS